MFSRKLDIHKALSRKSAFFFGPRGTGKTSLIRRSLGSNCLFIDLLKSSNYTMLLANPSELESIIRAHSKKIVAIDEVQKVPALLDEVHRLIEEKGHRFLLTGSSARKLKREHANMLAGRALKLELFPLVSAEIPHFDLSHALRFGTLPAIYTSDSPEDDLDAYVTTYLKEEIEIECRLRNLPAFARFLKVAALCSGTLINYAQIASDAAVAETTVKSHIQILIDTLLGYVLEPFVETKKRKAIATSKFYLFDNGVRHTLMRLENLERHSDIYGTAFESFIGNELRAYISYSRIHQDLTFWRSTSQFEVDFLIGTSVAIEVKSAARIGAHHLKGLTALAEEKIIKQFFIVSHDPVIRSESIGFGKNALLLPWNEFLVRLWAGEIV